MQQGGTYLLGLNEIIHIFWQQNAAQSVECYIPFQSCVLVNLCLVIKCFCEVWSKHFFILQNVAAVPYSIAICLREMQRDYLKWEMITSFTVFFSEMFSVIILPSSTLVNMSVFKL
jgi:hypothetical protein